VQVSINQNKKIYGLVFIFFFLIYLISNGGHLDNYDGIAYFLITENLVLEKSLKIDPNSPSVEKLQFDINGLLSSHGSLLSSASRNETSLKNYVNYAPFISAIGVPFYIIALMFNQNPIHFVPYFVNLIIITLTDLVVFAFALELYKSKKIAFVLSLLLGVTSYIWPYQSSMFTQPLLGLCAISSVYFLFLSGKSRIKHAEIFGGIILGMVSLAHPTGVMIIPGILVYALLLLRKDKRKIAKFLIFFILLISFTLYLNEVRFGSPLDFGYRDEQSLKFHNDITGLAGMIFSPGKGILFFFPISILVPLAIWKFLKQEKWLAILIIYIFLVYWLWFGTIINPYWGANGNWGSRYLVQSLPFLILPVGILIKNLNLRYIIIGLATTGFIVNLLGVLVWEMYDYTYGWERLGLWKFGDKSWDLFTWSGSYSPIVLSWQVLNSDYLSSLVSYPKQIGDFHHIGLAPCNYDSYLYCSNGIIPIIILMSLVAFTFYLIWRDIKIPPNIPSNC
jgi:hypothetical protein